MTAQLLLLQKQYDFFLWLQPIIARFPKWQRSLLGTKLYSVFLELYCFTIQANNQRLSVKRKQLQQEIKTQLDQLRLLIRLAKDLKLMSVRSYSHASKLLNEIGRMYQAWIKLS